MALDEAGRPRIRYSGYLTLKYAWHDGAIWHIETVDSDAALSASSGTSLALDAADRPHISYCDSYDDYVVHTWPEGPYWHRQIIMIATFSRSWSIWHRQWGLT